MNKFILISLITAATWCLSSCGDKEQAYIANKINETEQITILDSGTTESYSYEPETESAVETTTTDYVNMGLDIAKIVMEDFNNSNEENIIHHTGDGSVYELG